MPGSMRRYIFRMKRSPKTMDVLDCSALRTVGARSGWRSPQTLRNSRVPNPITPLANPSLLTPIMHFMHSTSAMPAKKTEIFKVLPEVWQLIRPRRALLALGLGLMVVNRVSGLVLPASTKYLVDDIIGKRHFKLLYPLVGVVLAATLI